MITTSEIRFLSVQDVAIRLGTSKSTIWRWCKERTDFPQPVKLGTGSTRWKIADLETFEASLGLVA